jgi:hypothetical protein
VNVGRTLADAGYMVVGFGVITAEHARVVATLVSTRFDSARTEYGPRVAGAVNDGKTRANDLAGTARERVMPVAERVRRPAEQLSARWTDVVVRSRGRVKGIVPA